MGRTGDRIRDRRVAERNGHARQSDVHLPPDRRPDGDEMIRPGDGGYASDPAPEGPPPEELGIVLSTVTPSTVTWLWPGRIPLGKLTILDGDPGLGKSVLTLDLAARVSRGKPMPCGAPVKAAGVVLLTAEDGLDDTVVPRLEAAGADLSRILALDKVPALEPGPCGRRRSLWTWRISALQWTAWRQLWSSLTRSWRTWST